MAIFRIMEIEECLCLSIHTHSLILNVSYKDANIVRDPKVVGDLSAVVRHVLNDRVLFDPSGKTGSDWTLGQINAELDNLAALPHKSRSEKEAHDQAKQNISGTLPSKKEPLKISDRRTKWVQNISKPPGRGGKALTPLEHKWLVRIILQEMQFGIGWKSLVRLLYIR
jgi:hypothetical protein